MLSIRDNGKGLHESEQEKLFERYYRGTNTKEKPEGSGLGLAIASQIIALHGGGITVNSQLGIGTVLVPVLFIPLFLSPNGTTGAYNLTLFLLPYRCVMPEIGKYISYQISGLVLDALSMRAILYAILTEVMLPLARLGFKKHQVA